VPRQELVEPCVGVTGHTGKGIGEPYAGVDLVQLPGDDERVLIAARSPPRSLPANSEASGGGRRHGERTRPRLR
jgi:hypothetical protein